MHYLVTYDVRTQTAAGRRRLSRVAHLCERYGVRVQYSVFEVRLDQVRRAQLESQLLEIIKTPGDSVNIYKLTGPPAASRITLGSKPDHETGQPWIL
jgi:CRISPR-associated protein Cas2